MQVSFFQYIYFEQEPSQSIKNLLDPNYPYLNKYLYLLDFVIWALFDTSFGNDTEILIAGKIITSGCMLVGVAYNIYILIQVLNIMNTIHEPRTKYYEVMNQLDAYMQMKQLPIHLQNRLKFFYKKKFRKFYYNEDEIMGSLSEQLQREILINTGKLFVERVQLFQDIPKTLVTQIAASCTKEQFLPNDLVKVSIRSIYCTNSLRRHFRFSKPGPSAVACTLSHQELFA